MVLAQSASIIRLAMTGVMSSAISGLGGASSTRMPAEWLMTNVSMDSGSPCSSSGMSSAIDLFFGFRLSRTPTSPNWNDPSTRQVFWPSSVAAATARLTASVVRPTPPFGPNTATTRPGSPGSRSAPIARSAGVAAAAAAGCTAIRDCFSRSRV